MEREMSVAELAKFWAVSINTTWKRINKDGLRTVQKPVNNREITFVIVDDDILNKYQVNNGVINADYEEILSDNKVNEVEKPDTIDKIMEYSRSINEQIMSLNEDYNQRINNLNNELITYKSKNLLLEDKAGREGMYINEINQLKKENEGYKQRLIILLTFTITLIIVLCIYAIYKFLPFITN